MLMIALGVGGMWGVIEALQKPRVQAQAHSTLNPSIPLTETLNNATHRSNPALNPATRQSGKLLLNNILNHVTRRGPFLGNSAGVLAMSYNLINGYFQTSPFLCMN
jgi:Tim17/Tim22/Tim23/Pmp24 family